jgi:hypothetical protein
MAVQHPGSDVDILEGHELDPILLASCSMPRDYRLYLDDIVSAIATIRSYTMGYDYEQFSIDKNRC